MQFPSWLVLPENPDNATKYNLASGRVRPGSTPCFLPSRFGEHDHLRVNKVQDSGEKSRAITSLASCVTMASSEAVSCTSAVVIVFDWTGPSNPLRAKLSDCYSTITFQSAG